MRIVVSVLAVCVCGTALAADWTGHWRGEGVMGEERVPIELHVAPAEDGYSATVTLPRDGWRNAPAWDVHEEDGSLVVEMDPRDVCVIRLREDAQELTGTWAWNDFQADVRLTPFTPDLPYTTEPVQFNNGALSFGGTLFLPEGDGPHPAIVCYHGSGDNDRWWLFDEADHFARLGIACLVFDKRGVGESAGHWEETDFEGLAEDGIAGVQMLKQRADIDPARIGVFGISQACWIMPLAATKSDDIAFIIAVSGAVTTVEEEGYYDYWYRMKEAGFSDEDWQQALALLELDNHFTRTGEGWDELMAAMREARKQPWWKAAEITPAPKGAIWRSFYRRIVDFDPVPYIRQLDVPTLWIYGSADETAPTHRSSEILKELVAENSHLPFTLVWLENASHGMRIPAPDGWRLPMPPYHPDYWPKIEAWLKQHVLEKK